MLNNKIIRKRFLEIYYNSKFFKKPWLSFLQKEFKIFDKNIFEDNKDEILKENNIKILLKNKIENKILVKQNKKPIQELIQLNKIEIFIGQVVLINGKVLKRLSSFFNFNRQFFVGSFKEGFSLYPNKIKRFFINKKCKNNNLSFFINDLFIEKGLFIYIPENVCIHKTLKLLFFSKNNKNNIYQKTLIYLESNSSLNLFEEYMGSNSYFSNFSCQVFLGKNASLKWQTILMNHKKSINVYNCTIMQYNNSFCQKHILNINGKYVRNNFKINLYGEKSSVETYTLDICNRHSQVNNNILVNHENIESQSKQQYKGILRDASKGCFKGKVHVFKGADKIKATQISKNLILSKNARSYSSPQLEIYEDNIKCNHGSTVGNLNSKNIFYLESRGISNDLAKKMLVLAFAQNIFNNIDNKYIASLLLNQVLL